MTILEAQVAPERGAALEQEYKEATRKLDPGIVQTLLLRSSADANLWRIATIWASREALAAMRQAGTPRGVLMFRGVGAEPALSIFDVVSNIALA